MQKRRKQIEGARRKPYRSPTLTCYGDIRELTRGYAGTGTSDAFGGSAQSPSPLPPSRRPR
jgi:hypothetical protein